MGFPNFDSENVNTAKHWFGGIYFRTLSACIARKIFCGAGGSRTLVQTRNPKAFYMLIRCLILLRAPGSRQPNARPSSFISLRGRNIPRGYLPIDDTPLPKRQEAGRKGGVLVPAPTWGAGIKEFYLVKLRSECIAIIAICCFEC